MKKVLFTCNWGESPRDLLERYKRQTPGCLGVWKEIQGVQEPSEADVFIVLEGVDQRIQIDYDRAILIKREPDFIDPGGAHSFKYTRTWEDGHCGLVWWLSLTYDQLLEMPYLEKPDRASCVASAKHRHRSKALKRLFGKSWLFSAPRSPEMDLYGRGFLRFAMGDRYQGAINGGAGCKLPGLLPYKYSMVLENSQQRNYWTEKLADAFLAWCVPLYWGCPNLSDYFPEASFREVGLSAAADEIDELTSMPVDESIVESLSVARMKILNEYNLWNVISEEIERTFP